MQDKSRPDWLRAHLVASPSEEEPARFARLTSEPETQATIAHFERVAARGPLTAVMIDRALEGGRLSIIHLGEPEPLTRFFVVSTIGLHDEILKRTMGFALAYETRHPADRDQVTITLYNDGRFESSSERYGRESGSYFHEQSTEARAQLQSEADLLLKLAAGVLPQEVPKVGLARVVTFRHQG